MDVVRQWAFSICCAMVACGIAQMILPKSNMQKMFQLCCSIFFLCCLLTPFFLQNPELRIDLQEISQKEIELKAQQLTAVLDEQTQLAAEDDLKKIIVQKLQEKGINTTSATIHITTVGQHHTSQEPVVEITLNRSYEERHEELRNDLSTYLGLEVRLGYR